LESNCAVLDAIESGALSVERWQSYQKLKAENEYAVSDRKAMEAGGGKYLNFITIILRKK